MHSSNLGGNWHVRIMGDDGPEFKGKRNIAIINQQANDGIVLLPTQALALLSFLTQEKAFLEQLASEQNNDSPYPLEEENIS